MEFALKRVKSVTDGRLQELKKVLLDKEQATFSELDAVAPVPLQDRLNASQNKAIQQVMLASDLAIIHGPPGTGKTTTLVQVIQRTLDNEKQVLVCAPSNTAVDLLTERLAEEGVKVLRIGNPARISESLEAYSLEGQMSKHPEYKRLRKLRKDVVEYRSLARKYKRSFGRAEREQR